MTTARNGTETDFGRLGSFPAIEFWNAFLSVTSSLSQSFILRWGEITRRMATGDFTNSQVMSELGGMWIEWASLATFPFEWWTRYTKQVPTLVFLVNEYGETQGPTSLATPVIVPDLKIEVTELRQVGGDKTLNRKCLDLELNPDGTRLGGKFVNLNRCQDTIHPGLYLGLAYARGGTEIHPLALICIFAELQKERTARSMEDPDAKKPIEVATGV